MSAIPQGADPLWQSITVESWDDPMEDRRCASIRVALPGGAVHRETAGYMNHATLLTLSAGEVQDVLYGWECRIQDRMRLLALTGDHRT